MLLPTQLVLLAVVLFGLLGNGLSVAVLDQRAFARLPVTLALRTLAVTDSSLLLVTFLKLDLINLPQWDLVSRVLCFIRTTSVMLSQQMILLITADRFTSIIFYSKPAKMMSMFKMKVCIGVLVPVTAGLVSVWAIFGAIEDNHACVLDERSSLGNGRFIFQALYLAAYSVVPIPAAFILNTVAAMSLWKKKMVGEIRHKNVSVMLFVTVFVFIVLCVPYMITVGIVVVDRSNQRGGAAVTPASPYGEFNMTTVPITAETVDNFRHIPFEKEIINDTDNGLQVSVEFSIDKQAANWSVATEVVHNVTMLDDHITTILPAIFDNETSAVDDQTVSASTVTTPNISTHQYDHTTHTVGLLDDETSTITEQNVPESEENTANVTGIARAMLKPYQQMLLDVTEVLFTINYACNFVVYVLVGRRFRKAFFNIFPCSRNSQVGVAPAGARVVGGGQQNKSSDTGDDKRTGQQNPTSATRSIKQTGSTAISGVVTSQNVLRTDMIVKQLTHPQQRAENTTSSSDSMERGQPPAGGDNKASANGNPCTRQSSAWR